MLLRHEFDGRPSGHAIRAFGIFIAIDVEPASILLRQAIFADIVRAPDFNDTTHRKHWRAGYGVGSPANIVPEAEMHGVSLVCTGTVLYPVT